MTSERPGSVANNYLDVRSASVLSFEVTAGDSPFRPEVICRSALEVYATTGVKLADLRMAREPFLAILDAVAGSSGTFHITTRFAFTGSTETPRFAAQLLITGVGGPGADAETTALAAYAKASLSAPYSPYVVAEIAPPEWAWAEGTQVTLFRQSEITVGEGAASDTELPVRFTWPGPDALPRLVRTLASAGPGVELLVTASPTSLRDDERARLAEIRVLAAATNGAERVRDAATALDAVLSFRADVFRLQVALIHPPGLAEVAKSALARCLSAGFDTEPGLGYRVVASPHRFVGGGVVLDPCRAPRDLLSRLAFGLPQSGTVPRRLTELVTATEAGYCFGWGIEGHGILPGMPVGGDVAAVVPDDADAATYGTDPRGNPVRVPLRDRFLHTAVLGASGFGKTVLLGSLAAQDLAAGHGVVAIDAHGDLLDRVAESVPDDRVGEVVILDCRDGHADRSNLLGLASPGSAIQSRVNGAIVDGSVADLNPDFSGPVFFRLMNRCVTLASLAGERLTTVGRYLNDPDLISETGRRVGYPETDALVAELRCRQDRGELATYVAAKLHWLDDAAVAATLDSPFPSVDLAAVIKAGGVVLLHPGDDPPAAAVVTSVILAVVLALSSNRNLTSHPLDLFVDEAQRCGGALLRRAMNEARKRAIACHLATQNLTNVKGSAEALLGNAGTIVLGRSTGPTAAIARDLLGTDPSMLAALPNLRALCRASVAGVPQLPVTIDLPLPSAPQLGLARFDKLVASRRAEADSTKLAKTHASRQVRED